MGYLNNEEATLKTFDPNGYLKTGDQGILTADNYLTITGRIKEIIVTAGGENVAPIPIEDKFKESCPACSNIMVIGEGQRFIGALITLKCVVDPKGAPTDNLLPDTIKYFKSLTNKEIKTSSEACRNQQIIKVI